MSEISITCLIENRAPERLAAEHGLCVHISFMGHSILLDTGASGAFAENAEKLGVDLAAVEVAALSHAHYDHSGGYEAFFAANGRAEVYLRAEGRQRCYGVSGPEPRYIGIPDGILEKHAARFVFVNEKTQLLPGVFLLGHSTPGLESRGAAAHMCRESGNGLIPDDFAHEQSLIFDTSRGLVVINSCCHAGADTVAREALEAFPGRRLCMLIGGFHLMGSTGADSMGPTEAEVIALARRLEALGAETIYTGHCTGTPAYEILERTLPGRVKYFCTGTTAGF